MSRVHLHCHFYVLLTQYDSIPLITLRSSTASQLGSINRENVERGIPCAEGDAFEQRAPFGEFGKRGRCVVSVRGYRKLLAGGGSTGGSSKPNRAAVVVGASERTRSRSGLWRSLGCLSLPLSSYDVESLMVSPNSAVRPTNSESVTFLGPPRTL